MVICGPQRGEEESGRRRGRVGSAARKSLVGGEPKLGGSQDNYHHTVNLAILSALSRAANGIVSVLGRHT